MDKTNCIIAIRVTYNINYSDKLNGYRTVYLMIFDRSWLLETYWRTIIFLNVKRKTT